MTYHISLQTEKTRFFTEVYSCSEIPYFTVKGMRKRYPDGNFVIIGEIGCLEHAPADGDWLCTEDGKAIPIFPRGSMKRPFEWVLGYTSVQENSYIAVIGGVLHLLVGIRCNVKRKMGK